jgi:hypothetical protein
MNIVIHWIMDLSLLPIVPKVCEKLLLKRLLKMVENNVFIPNHQFGFRARWSTIQQTQRSVERINEVLEIKHIVLHILKHISSI